MDVYDGTIVSHSLEVLQALSRDKASLMFVRGKKVWVAVPRNFNDLKHDLKMCMIGQPNEPSLLVMMQFVGQKDQMIIDGLLNSNPRCASDALLTIYTLQEEHSLLTGL